MKKNNFRNMFIFALPTTLTACGAIYTSPKVSKSNDFVEIVDASPYSVEYANKAPYTPQKLPNAFRTVGSERRILPIALLQKQSLSRNTQFNTPPNKSTGTYRIGVSDVLLLATPTPSTPDQLTGLIAAQNRRQGYTVQDDGAIAVPDVGRIDIVGKTLAEAENAVFNALVDKQIDPKFSLEVAEFNSQTVSVAGAVKEARLVPISLNPLRLQNAIQQAGGIATKDPNLAAVRITRNGKTYQIPMHELRKQTDLQNLKLQNGDSVVVIEDFNLDRELELSHAKISARAQSLNEAESVRASFLQQLELGAIKADYVYLTGEVRQQNRFRLPFENKASLADALYSENGIRNQDGDPGQIYLIRKKNVPDGKPITAYHINGKYASNLLLATQLELRPNDIIFVSEQRVTAWNRIISNILPATTIVDRTVSK